MSKLLNKIALFPYNIYGSDMNSRRTEGIVKNNTVKYERKGEEAII